jgi:hypothetical protein
MKLLPQDKIEFVGFLFGYFLAEAGMYIMLVISCAVLLSLHWCYWISIPVGIAMLGLMGLFFRCCWRPFPSLEYTQLVFQLHGVQCLLAAVLPFFKYIPRGSWDSDGSWITILMMPLILLDMGMYLVIWASSNIFFTIERSVPPPLWKSIGSPIWSLLILGGVFDILDWIGILDYILVWIL